MRLTNEKQGQSTQMQKAFQKETVTFRELTFKKKIEYIWDYYKWWILGVTFAIAFICYLVPSIIDAHREVALYTACINSNIVSQENTTLMDDFVKYSGIDVEGKKIILDTGMYINRGLPDNYAVESTQKLFALISTQTIDVLLLDRENYDYYVQQDIFTDLTQVLSAEQLEKYKDLLIYSNTQSGESKPFAIDTTNCRILNKEQAFITQQDGQAKIAQSCYTIPQNAKQVENAVKFLDFLMSQN